MPYDEDEQTVRGEEQPRGQRLLDVNKKAKTIASSSTSITPPVVPSDVALSCTTNSQVLNGNGMLSNGVVKGNGNHDLIHDPISNMYFEKNEYVRLTLQSLKYLGYK